MLKSEKQRKTGKSEPEIDKIFMLENIVRMISSNLRVISSTNGYEILVTPIRSIADRLKFGYRNEQYYIEMPFADVAQELLAVLREDGYIKDAFNKYYEQVTKFPLFAENIDYISDTNEKTKTDVEVKYKQLIRKCLELLQDSNYKEFNKTVLKKTDDEKSKIIHIQILLISITISHVE